LRDKLVLSHKSVYYIAMVRQNWFWYLLWACFDYSKFSKITVTLLDIRSLNLFFFNEIKQVVNVVLRLSWMQLVLELHWRPLHRVAIITFISCLEIIRRGIWNFFR
jgi:hypothetical protein